MRPALLCLFAIAGVGDAVETIGRVGDPALREMSGLARSRRHDGVFWAHPDSGNAPVLFALDAEGRPLGRVRLAVPNVDWEDIATDDAGHLVVGDIGNNLRLSPVGRIHVFDEPDPRQLPEAPLRPIRSITYRFEDGAPLDAEALFVEGAWAILIEKRGDGQAPRLFSVRIDRSVGLLRPAVAKLVGRLDGFAAPVTGADLSADGRHLAVCAPKGAAIFEREASGAWRLLRMVALPVNSVEAVAWDGTDVILGDESGWLGRWRDPLGSARRRRDAP
jgi:hypothetical protein